MTETQAETLLMNRACSLALVGLTVIIAIACYRWWANRPTLRKTLFAAQSAVIKEGMRADALQAALRRALQQPRELMDWLRSRQAGLVDDYGRGWETCAEEVIGRLTYRGIPPDRGACWVPGCTRPARTDSLYCMEPHPPREGDGIVKGGPL